MIFIKNNVASSKNSKQWTGRMLIKSKLSLKYEKSTQNDWITYKDEFLKLIKNKSKPYLIGFHFVRDSKRKADFQNLLQLPLDLMQKHGWLEDDCMSECLPTPFKINEQYFSINKENPGVWITIIN